MNFKLETWLKGYKKTVPFYGHWNMAKSSPNKDKAITYWLEKYNSGTTLTGKQLAEAMGIPIGSAFRYIKLAKDRLNVVQ